MYMKKINEIGIGSFRPGKDISGSFNYRLGNGGPTSNADSMISQRMQYNVGESHDDIEEEEEMEDTILECRVYKKGKYCLIETLQNLNEENIDSSDINAMAIKIRNQNRDRLNKTKNLKNMEDYIDDNLDEYSGSAAIGGGPAVPIGHTAKGKPETPSQRRKRQNFNITKSYPYTKLANPPRNSKKRRKKRK